MGQFISLCGPRYIQTHAWHCPWSEQDVFLNCLDKVSCDFSTRKQGKKVRISICPQTLRLRYTAHHVRRNLILKIFICWDTHFPHVFRANQKWITHLTNAFLMPVQPFATAPGHLKSAGVRTCSCVRCFRWRTFWAFVVFCDLTDSKFPTGNLYYKWVIWAVSKIIRRVFIATIRQRQPYSSCILVLFDTATCFGCSLQP